ncbi:MAG: hypothetical protein LBG67_02725 [Campylobacteraceae bacterium]|jgi:hypothetical protein|nr:hypothetical protein [Campylobacteraceae bacterium]
MAQMEQIEIQLSKKKMFLTFLGAMVFVGLGLFMLINPSMSTKYNSTFVAIVGLFSVLFFGLAAIIIFRKLLDKKAGLIINQQGIIDNSSGVVAGLILWEDIEEVMVLNVSGQKFLMFIVKNPQEYIDKATSLFQRKMMKLNYRMYGSPISISANALQMNFDNLHKLLVEKMKECHNIKIYRL